MGGELLKPQKWDPGVCFVIIAQSNITGQSLNRINAFLWTVSLLLLLGFAFSSQSRCFSWILLCRNYRDCLFSGWEKAQSCCWSVTSASSKILGNPPLWSHLYTGAPTRPQLSSLLPSRRLSSPKIVFLHPESGLVQTIVFSVLAVTLCLLGPVSQSF